MILDSVHIVVAVKPASKAFVKNAAEYGVAGLNIDSCRISTGDGEPAYSYPSGPGGVYSKKYQEESAIAACWNKLSTIQDNQPSVGHESGRWPSNVIHSGGIVVQLFPNSKGQFIKKSCPNPIIRGYVFRGTFQSNRGERGYDDEGSASRFFQECCQND